MPNVFLEEQYGPNLRVPGSAFMARRNAGKGQHNYGPTAVEDKLEKSTEEGYRRLLIARSYKQ